MERERDFDQRKMFWEASERSADQRAGLVASMVLNVNRADENAKLWSEFDFYPHLKPKTSDADTPDADMMDTEESVRHISRGFSLFVPPAMHERVGL